MLVLHQEMRLQSSFVQMSIKKTISLTAHWRMAAVCDLTLLMLPLAE